jgi:hypothetical protein
MGIERATMKSPTCADRLRLEKYRSRYLEERGYHQHGVGNNGVFLVPKGDGWNYQCIVSDGEEWKPIEGYEELYEVSNTGKVIALPKEVSIPNGAKRRHERHEVAQEMMDKGYKRVSLCRNGEINKVLVHVLVASAYIPNPHDYPILNHRDGDKGNNHVLNLEWCTQAYNQHHAIESGLRPGITTAQIEEIRDLLDKGLTTKQIAEQVGRSRQRIADIQSGRHRALDPAPPSRFPEPNLFWEHVSVVMVRNREERSPTWEEMCVVKAIFWRPDECVVQYHPPEVDYVNLHPYALHLWKPIEGEIVRPPTWMVG